MVSALMLKCMVSSSAALPFLSRYKLPVNVPHHFGAGSNVRSCHVSSSVTNPIENVPSTSSTVLSLRGGGEGDMNFDLGRAKTRLDGLASYPVVTTLLMNVALGMNNGTPKKIKPIPTDADDVTITKIKIDNAITVAFAAICSTSVALAAYTTIVFTMMSIYSKTALGMNLDDKFVTFFSSCAQFRQSGFLSFLGSLIGFSISLGLSFYLKNNSSTDEGLELIKWAQTVPACAMAIAGVYHYGSIMKLARELIFAYM